jgi:hypothetical protein
MTSLNLTTETYDCMAMERHCSLEAHPLIVGRDAGATKLTWLLTSKT